MSPGLVPVDLDATSLRIGTRCCRLPRGRHLPIVAAAGTVGQLVPPERDRLALRWAMDELRTEHWSHLGMVLDARGLRSLGGADALSVDLFPEEVVERGQPWGLVADDISALAARFPAHRLDRDLDALVRQITDQSAGPVEDYAVDASALALRAHSWSLGGEAAAWVEVEGFYPRGSAGDDDARFVRWRLRRVRDLLEPRIWLIDLRQLDYEWGDKLDPDPRSLERDERDERVRFVIDPARVEAFRYAIPAELTCASLEQAVAALAAP